MNLEELKKNFEDQLEVAEKQISELQSNLEKATEYKLKLQGGLETLQLLEQQEESPIETE